MDESRVKHDVSRPPITSTACMLLALLLGSSPNLHAQDHERHPETPTFIVYPVKTELQRLCLAPPKGDGALVNTFVAIHGGAAITKEGLIDPALVPVDSVSGALKRVADRRNGTVVMNLFFGTEHHTRPAVDLMVATFEGVGRRSGFESTYVYPTYINRRGNDHWEETLEALTIKGDGRADEDEIPTGTDLVKVYPVRTALSLMLTGNSDCVIDIRTPLEKKGDRLLSPEVHDAIVKIASTMTFRDTGKVLFRIGYLTERIPEQRFQKFLKVEAPDLARTLGFKGWAVQSK
jgi:hypothetical protein